MHKDIHRKGILVISGVVLALGLMGAVLLWNASQEIQLLQDSLIRQDNGSTAFGYTVRGNRLYGIGPRATTFTILSQSLWGGPTDTVAQVPRPGFGAILFAQKEILILTQDTSSFPKTPDPMVYPGPHGRTYAYAGPYRATGRSEQFPNVTIKTIPRYRYAKFPAPTLTRLTYGTREVPSQQRG